MFYYPTVLKRNSGCFSTIWLVATKGIRIPRREFLRVNVISTCDDIMNYVLERVPPPRPGLPRPRFSLYLSSQLQYGVIVVYHRQCAILLEDAQTIVGQLARKRKSQKIDMDDLSKQMLLNLDALSLQEHTKGAPDPFFGVMRSQELMPSPTTLIQMSQQYLSEASPEQPVVSRSPTAPESGITASPDAITLREAEPVTFPAAEFEGPELTEHYPDTLDLLLAEIDHFGGEDMEAAGEGEEEMEREHERGEDDSEREKTKEPTGSTIELQPTTVSSEDAFMPPEEEPGLEGPESLGPPTDQVTPVSPPMLPSPPAGPEKHGRQRRALPELEDVLPPKAKARKRKRQLIFFDPETQLPQEVLQEQIEDPLIETCRPLLPTPPSQKMLPAADLLRDSCTLLPGEMQFLWRQAATVTPLSGSDLQVGERGPESTDSEKDKESETAQRQQDEPSATEVPREAESELFAEDISGSLQLEGSDQREATQDISPLYISDRERSPISRSLSKLQDIPEEVEEALGRVSVALPGMMPEFAEPDAAPVSFLSLLPPKAGRRFVSHSFWRLLENLSSRTLRVEQVEPHGDIWILPGLNYGEQDLSV